MPYNLAANMPAPYAGEIDENIHLISGNWKRNSSLSESRKKSFRITLPFPAKTICFLE